MELEEINYYQYLLQKHSKYSVVDIGNYIHEYTEKTLEQYLQNPQKNLSSTPPSSILDSLPMGDLLLDDHAIVCPDGIDPELLSLTPLTVENEIKNLIGIVTCVHFSSDRQQTNILGSWIYSPGLNGKNKLNWAVETINDLLVKQQLECRYVLMDIWYASQKFMAIVDGCEKTYYCQLKSNRLVSDRGARRNYQQVCELEWTETEKQSGKIIDVKNFPKGKKLKLFLLELSGHRTAYIATNNLDRSDLNEVQDIYIFRNF
jgi:hypothetical protein